MESLRSPFVPVTPKRITMSLAYQNLIDEHACPTAKLNKYIKVQAQTVAPEIEVDSAHDPEFGELYRVWRSYHLLKRKMVVVSALALLVYPSFSMPAQANPIAPECKNIPTCIVVGTVGIGGIVYYVIKNTVTGVVQRVPAKQMPPAHSNEQHEE